MFCFYEGIEILFSTYGIFLSIGILGTMISEYTTKVEDDADCILFT